MLKEAIIAIENLTTATIDIWESWNRFTSGRNSSRMKTKVEEEEVLCRNDLTSRFRRFKFRWIGWAHNMELVEKLAESISHHSNVRVSETTRTLLEKTQHQAEQMRSQEEIRQNMEELEATREEK